jgi:hypothetical protein
MQRRKRIFYFFYLFRLLEPPDHSDSPTPLAVLCLFLFFGHPTLFRHELELADGKAKKNIKRERIFKLT